MARALARIPTMRSWTVADLGTGSGAIALAIAGERPLCQSAATISASRARRRPSQCAEPQCAMLLQAGDWFAPSAKNRLGQVALPHDLSNPPYIGAGMGGTDPESVSRPRLAWTAVAMGSPPTASHGRCSAIPAPWGLAAAGAWLRAGRGRLWLPEARRFRHISTTLTLRQAARAEVSCGLP